MDRVREKYEMFSEYIEIELERKSNKRKGKEKMEDYERMK